MPSAAVWICELGFWGVVEGILAGLMREEVGLETGFGAERCLRISRSSKSEATSEISPSEGSLSRSLSSTSSIRACDIVIVVFLRKEVGLKFEPGEATEPRLTARDLRCSVNNSIHCNVCSFSRYLSTYLTKLVEIPTKTCCFLI